jgi:hypothetical protein
MSQRTRWENLEDDRKILVRDSKNSRPRYLVGFHSIIRSLHINLPHLDGSDYCLPLPQVPLFETYAKDIGKFSAISSSKQQLSVAILDELLRRCGMKDA